MNDGDTSMKSDESDKLELEILSLKRISLKKTVSLRNLLRQLGIFST